MPDKKISQLPAAGALDGTEAVPVDQVSVTVQTTTGDIAALAGGGGGGFWEYDGSTLQPDPATTTPLDMFLVNVDGGFVTQSIEINGSNAHLQSLLDSDSSHITQVVTDTGADISNVHMLAGTGGPSADFELIADSSGPTAFVVVTLDDGAGSTGEINVAAGSFSLQADDGTYTNFVAGGGSSGGIGVYDSAVNDKIIAIQIGGIDTVAGTGSLGLDNSPNGASTRHSHIEMSTNNDIAGVAYTELDAFLDNMDFAFFRVLANDNADTLAAVFGGLVSAPDDTDLADSQFALWLDDTPGATKLMVKAKDSGGTVRTTAIALT